MRPFIKLPSCGVSLCASSCSSTRRALHSLTSLTATARFNTPHEFPSFRRGTLALYTLLGHTTRTGAPTTHSTRFVTNRKSGSNNETAHENQTQGFRSAEMLIPEESEAYNTNSNVNSDGSYQKEFAGDNFFGSDTPQTEPTLDSARAALQRRRQLFARCTNLQDVVESELRAEVARDMKDGVAAVPPLAPSGWRILHPTGSSYFTMTRVENGGSYTGGRRCHDSTCDSHESAGVSAAPRYQSVHDMMTHGRGQRTTATKSSSEKQASTQQQQGKQMRGPQFLHDTERDSGRIRYVRSDTHVTLFAPFRTLDLTLYNPRVDICEWTRFDVLVRKSKPTMKATSKRRQQQQQLDSTPLEGQQRIWDEGRCIFFRLACVNGELRIRSVQFVSSKLARALEEHAVFGRGEPLYMELLRRCRYERTVGRADGNGRWETAVSPLNVFDAPGSPNSTAAAPDEAADSRELQDPLLPAPVGTSSSLSGDGVSLLTGQFGRSGEYARSFVYGGPYLTELSKELREALHEYVMLHLGITNEVAEYVCQMQFFLEQEEYVGWLAQWGQLATTVRQIL